MCFFSCDSMMMIDVSHAVEMLIVGMMKVISNMKNVCWFFAR